MSWHDELAHVAQGLELSRQALAELDHEQLEVRDKPGGPVSEADLRVDAILHEHLPRAGEAWLSEETEDDLARLKHERLWIVDPIDGTKSYLAGRPEWCVSVGLVENGQPVVGGILNPSRDELFLGAAGHGVTLNGEPVACSERTELAGASVLASRSERKRGEWDDARLRQFSLRSVGSVAYKLALVAAGQADATFTLQPKNEWDVAGGAALVEAAGGRILDLTGAPLVLNDPVVRLSGLQASGSSLAPALTSLVGELAPDRPVRMPGKRPSP
ncbi:MAG: 3'(2'),5'-bisphosphate nucleotidase CysQ [Acidobacteriota bacterium]